MIKQDYAKKEKYNLVDNPEKLFPFWYFFSAFMAGLSVFLFFLQ